MKLSQMLVGFLLALGLVACSSTTKLQNPAVSASKPQVEGNKGDTLFLIKPTAGGSKDIQKVLPKAAVVQIETKPMPATGMNENVVVDRVVYFDFDSFVVKPEFEVLLQTQAQKMSGNKALKLVIAGHADERGGREYNLALGQKRAEAVRRALKALGLADDRIETISYGKEKPADEGHNEAAWSKNRRADLMSSTK
jgi:peptidoglycan-associated lipoprotein